MHEPRKTCQCCTRAILANTGLVAHHGYQRPELGWQTGSCMGARFLPFEASRERLGDLIDMIKRELVSYRNTAADIAADAIPLRFEYTTRGHGERINRYVMTTRREFDAVRDAYRHEMMQYGIYDFDALKKRSMAAIGHRIMHADRELAMQCKRFDGWKQTERWTGDAWAVLQTEDA